MDRKSLALMGALGVAGLGVYLTFLWQPERQVDLHQKHFLAALEGRDWNRFGGFISESYSDRWGHDKKFLLKEPREIFQQFVFLSIQQQPATIDAQGNDFRISARLLIHGTGGPLAEFAMERVNALSKPFLFHWQRQSWKPWDWALVEIEQPQLEVPEF